MAIEALYPYVAIAYGTFGILFGVYLWTKTRGYIFGTKHAIEAQVAAAVTDIGNKVDERLAGADTQGFEARLMAKLDEVVPSETEIAQRVADTINGMRGAEVTQLQQQLAATGIGEALAEQAQQFIPPSAIQAQSILNKKLTKKYESEHPIESLIWEFGKLGFAQFAESQGAFGEFLGGAIENSPRRRLASNSQGGEWSPGVR